MEERAFAIAGPAMVYVENRFSGFARRTGTNEPLFTGAVSFAFRCSGFVVEGQSHVLSSTHCIKPTDDVLRLSALNQVANERVKAGQLTADQKDAYIRDNNNAATVFTGDTAGSPPNQRVFAQLFQGQVGLLTEPATEGQVVDSIPIAEGDVALLKFPLAGMPAVEFSKDEINLSTPLVMLAFATDGGNTYLARSKVVRISGRIGDKSPALYQMDGDLNFASHGGMVVDSDGRVVGMINTDATSKDKLNRMLVTNDYLKGLMDRAKIGNSLSGTDQSYRQGINDYFGGRYESAISKLDSVISVMPENAIAKSYRKQASERLAVEGDSSSGISWMFVTAGLGVTQLISLILIVVLLLGRRRRMQTAGASGLGLYSPISGMPVSGSPISITPISGGPYETYHTFHEGPTRLNPDEYTTLPIDDPQRPESQRDPGDPWAPRQ